MQTQLTKYKKVMIFCEKRIVTGLMVVLLVTSWACREDKSKDKIADIKEEKVVLVPTFNPDSAYFFIEQQVAFGPRVPGQKEHIQTGDYLVKTLKSFSANVIEQKFSTTTYDGHQVELRNIIASFFPEKTKRILLAAHWDTRPFADKDKDKPNEAAQGANDGASGVGVLLEIARVLGRGPSPEVGVDIIFFDGEDWGERVDAGYVNTPDSLESWWCLGSQHWSKNKHDPNYSAFYGILLDMVGARGSQFHREGLSMRVAPKIVAKIWDRAHKMGYSGFFVKKNRAEITDDHKFVNEIAKIPMVNIVHYDPQHGYFGDYHHTHKDHIDLIDKEVLKIVGTVVLNVVYYE